MPWVESFSSDSLSNFGKTIEISLLLLLLRLVVTVF